MAFSAKTSGSDDLKAIISAISTLVEEATFVATAEGITFRGMDPSHVALIDISWPNSAFEKYECDSNIKFGVRIDEFTKLIKRADKKDSITISVSKDSMLLIDIGSNKKYKIRLIESSATDTPLPKISYDAKIELATTSFEKILGDVQVVSDYLTIKAKPTGVEFAGKGDSGEAAIDVKKDDDSMEALKVKKESEGTYSLEYLNPIVRAVGGAAGSVTCEFSDAKPLRVEFKVANIGRIHFYLAPRVSS
ncbi:DNA polymerase sliding clamp subunit (PCNA) [Cenarchaeum symbiosum A]|uniref:DNA polymerase sliding clamp n=1 Tax=Cenarchaeum symbiosum (strain A) TaxID=414004 RepID=PCNA_CENSY|nr:RecName: Full=DNA polymerase sliding clamp; AltName: Full=Proliferating cell nuclear antigen homolog; Short=PCNA [Cenarchaeum symbiosum A]ABK78044.1 DNA polymerase sliding clamp subunit (PCNA) [Cenarchaeum symbiosum A]